MALSELKIKNAKPKAKAYKLFDGDGLYLEISPSGGKWWRLKFRHDGKESRMSLGIYPEINLSEARKRCFKAREQLAHGINPSQQRKYDKARSLEAAANTFEGVAREWLEQTKAKRSKGTNQTIQSRMEADLYPWLGQKPVSAITAPELLATLKRVEARGSLIVAKRLRQIAGQVFRFAVVTGLADYDPSAALRGALKSPQIERHHAALTEPSDVGPLLRAIDDYQGYPVTRCALQLAPLVFVRPGELRQAEWSEIDLEAAEWRIPAAKMKMKNSHMVPLSQQAVAILRDIQPLTGRSRYVFPSVRTNLRPMSNNTVNASLRRLGYTREQMTGHGFRAMARTLLAEQGWKPDAIERQLAHKASGPLGAAYDRAQFLDERRAMMQSWADYLDSLKRGAQIIPLFKSA